MGSLKRAISYLLGNELQRLFLTLIEESVETYINEEAYLKLREILENKSEKFPAKESLVLLLKFMNKDLNWQTALRSLMIIHRLIHDMGEKFCEDLHATKIKLFADFKRHTSPLRTLVHSTLIPIYTNYIQKFSYNYVSLKVCFAKSDIQEELKANDQTLFHFITRIQNILVYLLKLIPFLETSFIHFYDVQLMKQLTYYIMTDCFNYYKYINDLLDITLKRIFELKSEDAFFLYEIYCENIKITKKVQSLFALRNHVDDFEITEPTLFETDVDFNKKLEFYIKKLKAEYNTKSDEIKSVKRIKLEYTEPESLATEESENPEKLTIEDLSKIIFGPQTPSVQNPTEIFKAPLSSKRATIEKENNNPVEETKEISELCQIVVHKVGQADTAMPVKQIYFNKKDEISREPSPNRELSTIQINSN